MSGLLWIVIGLGVGLLALGLYFFNSTRRDEHSPFPLNDSQRGSLELDPLSQAPLPPSAGEPPVETRKEPQAEFDELGVSPVRLRPQDEAAAARLAAGRARRTPRFNYTGHPREEAPPERARREPRFDPVLDDPVSSPSSEPPKTPPATQTLQKSSEPTPPPKSTSGSGAAEPAAPKRAEQAADVIPLYLIARNPSGFAGSELLPLFARLGFVFGEMEVYHYVNARGQTLFSLMNGVAPGTFDLGALAQQTTPALALFLRLPIERQPGLALEQFLDLAYRMADELDATLLDDRREALSTESVDRMRAAVLDD